MEEAKRITRPNSPRWLIPILILVGVVVFIRLGFWQLDRLSQRKAHNAQVAARLSMPPLDLNSTVIPSDPAQLDYRPAQATGQYDFSRQVVLGGQVLNGQVGGHLLTPLVQAGTGKVLLVDRGWIPEKDLEQKNWNQYDQPGTVTVLGRLKVPVNPALSPALTSNDQAQADLVPTINISYISQLKGTTLLPVYLQAAPTAGAGYPQAALSPIDLSEGPHLSYAIQWFSFAAGLLLGYPIYLVYRRRHPGRGQADA